MSQNIEGKVVVITGASSGLGEATARHLAERGAKLVLGARRMDRIQTLADELSKTGADAVAVQTDVTQRDQVEALIKTALNTFGKVDVLLNNAGIMPQALLEKLQVSEWDQQIDVNIKGVLYGIAAALPHMQERKSGHIINVSSVAGHKVLPPGTVYCATKHAVRAISEGLRMEMTPYNIRSTILSPGAVATELNNSITDPEVAEGMKAFYEQVAIPADSFARAVAFALEQPADVDINEILFRPTAQEV
ncbi:SDR family oxidoreductase [Gilvimarinus sp. DA14]|uniref:SDR family oxidoreductase n=1 Tax=Gilvimarinus sp. DA14 TaxID=2956798 RepID=UPI0020B71AB1|nr:SDR family oxidoreductase [Gilvimarinus sp. DA14]UTF60635.1 SDR family oxidoreductase [Gilvimarinus sp. DA14]